MQVLVILMKKILKLAAEIHDPMYEVNEPYVATGMDFNQECFIGLYF